MKNQTTFHLRIPESTVEELELASQKTGLTVQNICRLALSLGLTQLAKEHYHIAPALKAQAEEEAAVKRASGEPGVDFPVDG